MTDYRKISGKKIPKQALSNTILNNSNVKEVKWEIIF